MRDYLPIPLNGVLDSCNTLSWTVTLVRKLATFMSVGRNERDVSGLQIEWCGGMSDGECSLHCQVTFGQQAKHTCYSKYVNLKY